MDERYMWVHPTRDAVHPDSWTQGEHKARRWFASLLARQATSRSPYSPTECLKFALRVNEGPPPGIDKAKWDAAWSDGNLREIAERWLGHPSCQREMFELARSVPPKVWLVIAADPTEPSQSRVAAAKGLHDWTRSDEGKATAPRPEKKVVVEFVGLPAPPPPALPPAPPPPEASEPGLLPEPGEVAALVEEDEEEALDDLVAEVLG